MFAATALFVHYALRPVRPTSSPAPPASATSSAAAGAVRVLHFNVFEDGLADTPAAIGFRAGFKAELDILLATLCDDGQGRRLTGFEKTRDFQQLPRTVPLSHTVAFFGHLDDLCTSGRGGRAG